MNIPFVDLKAQYATIKDEIAPVIDDVLENTAFIGGPRLAAFENNFAQYVETNHAVGASSGTSAIHLALAALGIGRGDEVITAVNTFIATGEAITQSGARVVFVDVRSDTMNIDPDKIEAAITPRTRAIMPVHLYGQPADMDAIRDIAERHNLVVVADAAQAHGARYKDSRRAIQGLVSCYSFYPGKNLGAYGDGGMVTTNDEALAERMRMLLDHGRQDKYLHAQEGFNYRLDALQAVILDVKLRHLDSWTEARRSRAERYQQALADTPLETLSESPDCYHVYHLYVVKTPERERLITELGARGIAAGVHYPVPLHLQPAYEYLGHKRGDFPVAEAAAAQIVSLPMFPELSDDQVDAVAAATREILS